MKEVEQKFERINDFGLTRKEVGSMLNEADAYAEDISRDKQATHITIVVRAELKGG